VIQTEVSFTELYGGQSAYLEVLQLCDRQGLYPVYVKPGFINPRLREMLHCDFILARRTPAAELRVLKAAHLIRPSYGQWCAQQALAEVAAHQIVGQQRTACRPLPPSARRLPAARSPGAGLSCRPGTRRRR